MISVAVRQAERIDLERFIELLSAANHVYLCGNGGSAANAMHMANDLVAANVRAHALTADIATLTAIANDFGYHYVFSRQLAAFGQPGDLLIVLSGSGNSENILQALASAQMMEIASVAIVGGGDAASEADYVMLTPGGMQAAEEQQLEIGHAAMLRIKEVRGQH